MGSEKISMMLNMDFMEEHKTAIVLQGPLALVYFSGPWENISRDPGTANKKHFPGDGNFVR